MNPSAQPLTPTQMNIFFLHPNPTRCARWHCDKHVVKMILETTQLLYTAHWALSLDKGQIPRFPTAPAPKGYPQNHGYLPINNPTHPSALWTRQSLQHYAWLCLLGLALCKEYRFRYNGKTHSCEPHLIWLQQNVPQDLQDIGWTQPPQAMPDEYKVSKNSVVSYREYYKKGKTRMLTYTGRRKPHWLKS